MFTALIFYFLLIKMVLFGRVAFEITVFDIVCMCICLIGWIKCTLRGSASQWPFAKFEWGTVSPKGSVDYRLG
jgi:hypothetical protein